MDLKFQRIGRYTLCEINADDGVKAVGIARKAQGEKENADLGKSIAKGRAKKAIALKREHLTMHHNFMG